MTTAPQRAPAQRRPVLQADPGAMVRVDHGLVASPATAMGGGYLARAQHGHVGQIRDDLARRPTACRCTEYRLESKLTNGRGPITAGRRQPVTGGPLEAAA